MVQILIIDAERPARQHLRAMMYRLFTNVRICEKENSELPELLTGNIQFDLIIYNPGFRRRTSISGEFSRVRTVCNHSNILIRFTVDHRPSDLLRYVACGAKGLIAASEADDLEYANAIAAIMSGRSYFPELTKNQLIHELCLNL